MDDVVHGHCDDTFDNVRAALMLVDRGLVELTAPVARYWPEFSANGKHDIEFRHVLSHTSGVSGWDLPFTTEDMYDWEKATSALVPNKALPYVPDEKICFWGGWGGSMVVMCPDRRTTISYVMNKMGPGILGSDRMATYGTLIFDALPGRRPPEITGAP